MEIIELLAYGLLSFVLVKKIIKCLVLPWNPTKFIGCIKSKIASYNALIGMLEGKITKVGKLGGICIAIGCTYIIAICGIMLYFVGGHFIELVKAM